MSEIKVKAEVVTRGHVRVNIRECPGDEEEIKEYLESMAQNIVNKIAARKPHKFKSMYAMGSCDVPGCGQSGDRPIHDV